MVPVHKIMRANRNGVKIFPCKQSGTLPVGDGLTSFQTFPYSPFPCKLATACTRPITVISSLYIHAFVLIQAILTWRGLLTNIASLTILCNFFHSASFTTAFFLKVGASSVIIVSPSSYRGQEIRCFVFHLNNLVGGCIYQVKNVIVIAKVCKLKWIIFPSFTWFIHLSPHPFFHSFTFLNFLLFSDISPFINLFMNMVDSKQFLQTFP